MFEDKTLRESLLILIDPLVDYYNKRLGEITDKDKKNLKSDYMVTGSSGSMLLFLRFIVDILDDDDLKSLWTAFRFVMKEGE